MRVFGERRKGSETGPFPFGQKVDGQTGALAIDIAALFEFTPSLAQLSDLYLRLDPVPQRSSIDENAGKAHIVSAPPRRANDGPGLDHQRRWRAP